MSFFFDFTKEMMISQSSFSGQLKNNYQYLKCRIADIWLQLYRNKITKTLTSTIKQFQNPNNGRRMRKMMV